MRVMNEKGHLGLENGICSIRILFPALPLPYPLLAAKPFGLKSQQGKERTSKGFIEEDVMKMMYSSGLQPF